MGCFQDFETLGGTGSRNYSYTLKSATFIVITPGLSGHGFGICDAEGTYNIPLVLS